LLYGEHLRSSGTSFAEENKSLVKGLVQFFEKLGLATESGRRAEPRGVSEKVKERLRACEIFIGVFTRRNYLAEGSYSTSPWVVEEKAIAIGEGKRLLLFVEEGVKEIGGLQGD